MGMSTAKAVNITNSDDMNKENKNTSNSSMKTDNISNAYHGEYHKALTDALSLFLESAFKKHLESPYSSWLRFFEKSMENDVNKILHFYPILLHELKNKIQHHYLTEFEKISAAKNLGFLQNKMVLTFYRDTEGLEDENDEKSSSNDTSMISESEMIANAQIISYSDPKQTIRDQQLIKINATFRKEIQSMDQKIAMAQYKKNELLSKIEEKKKT